MTFLTIILSSIIIIPIIPLIAYVIGLVVPASHIVSRTTTLKLTSKQKLWAILTDVSRYSEWQSKVENVIIDEIDTSEARVVFVEYSTGKRQTVVVHHERTPYECLIRILEESPSISSKYQFKNKVPTFSGSWTFEMSQNENSQVILKITEQGIIKKPLVRITHLLVLGYHYRIDRFLNDLQSLIDKESKLDEHPIAEKVELVEEDESVHESVDKENESVHEENTILDTNVQEIEQDGKLDSSTIVTSSQVRLDVKAADDQQIEATDKSMIESKIISGWDLISEIYEHREAE